MLARLAGAGYLDDERVVRDRAARLAGRGYGDTAIRFELTNRGAACDVVEQAIAALDPEWSRVDRVVEKLGGGVRTARMLERKGFSEASVERALAAVAQDTRGGLG